MIRSFACDYETMERLAEIERDAILIQGDAEMIGARRQLSPSAKELLTMRSTLRLSSLSQWKPNVLAYPHPSITKPAH